MQTHAYKPSTQEGEAGRLRVEGQLGLSKEIPKANKNMQRKAEGLKIQKYKPTLALRGVPTGHMIKPGTMYTTRNSLTKASHLPVAAT